jgi:hypothetical protein
MIGFEANGTEIGVLDSFSVSGGAALDPPATPWLTGPTEVHVFEDAVAVLESSAFSDSDPADTHMQSVWRLSAVPDVEGVSDIVLEAVTGADTLTWSIDLAALQPGRTVYATVRHVASDGQVSGFADPLAIDLAPDPVYLEDFENSGEFVLPDGWVADHRTTVDQNTWDPEDPRSDTYLTWTVVSENRLSSVFGGNRVNVPRVVRGHSIYAESDRRTGVQLQYLTTRDYNLSQRTNVFLAFLSNYMQNQDSLGALEYSIDQGATWMPVVVLLDEPDIMWFEDNETIDAAATLTRVDPSHVPVESGRAVTGGTYGEHILSRPLASLGDFISGRINDDSIESKRFERFRLTSADGESQVRFRFTLVGTSSWFWGVDDFGLYGSVTELESVWITQLIRSRDTLELRWEGAPGPYQLEYRPSLFTGAWQDYGEPIPAEETSVQLPSNGGTGFYRIRAIQ